MPTHTAILAAILVSFSVFGAAPKPLSPQQEKLAKDADEILRTYCGKCHGKGGPWSDEMLLEHKELLKEEGRFVVPYKPEESKLYKKIEKGDMPPKDELPKLPGGRFPADGLKTLKAWIEAGAPKAPPPPRPPIIPNKKILEHILADLEKQDENERPFTRYFTITHLHNAGESKDAMRNYRTALSKMVNSLTWSKVIRNPTPIDANKTIFRIHLKHYDWDEDLWDEAIIKNHYPYPYDVDYPYIEHDKIKKMTRSKVPFVRADWFIANGAKPKLYHAMLNLPMTAQELEQVKLNIRGGLGKNILNGAGLGFKRAGFLKSGVSKFNRIVERYQFGGTGYYWKSYDFKSNKDEKNIFRFPLGPKYHFPNGAKGKAVELFPKSFEHDGGEIIFSLPNGLQAYLLVDEDGDRIDEAPIEIVQNLTGGPDDEPQISNGLSCMTCHTSGMKPFKDRAGDLRSIIEIADAGKVARNFDKKEALRILSKPGDINLQVELDAKQFEEAVEKTGGVVGNREPIAVLANYYESPINLTLAAAELGVKKEALVERIKDSVHLQEYGLYALLVESGPGLARESWENNYQAIFDRVIIKKPQNAPNFPFTFRAFSEEQKSNGSFTPVKGLAWRQNGVTGDLFSTGLVGRVGFQFPKLDLRRANFPLKFSQIVKWDTANWQPRFPDAPIIFNNTFRDVIKMEFSPADPDKLAVLSRIMEKDNKQWGVNARALEIFDLTRPAHKPVVIGINNFANTGLFAWSPDGKKIAIADRDLNRAFIRVYDSGTGEVHTFIAQNENRKDAFRVVKGAIAIHGIDWSPDGRLLAVAINHGLNNNRIEIWDADLEGNLGDPLALKKLDVQRVADLDWAPSNANRRIDQKFDSRIVISGMFNRLNIILVGEEKIKDPDKKLNIIVKKLNVRVDADNPIVGRPHLHSVLAWSPDGQKLALGIAINAGGGNLFGGQVEHGLIKIWDSENFEKPESSIDIKPRKFPFANVEAFLRSGVVSLAWRKDRKILAAGIEDGTIRVFDKFK